MIKQTFAALAAVAALAGPALAQTPAPRAECPKPGAPAVVQGEVVRVSMDENKVVLRASDGSMHEFNASKDTIKDIKVGDKLEAKLRKPAGCP
jgi:hypothetical protein